jgi:hypothetical protein
MMPAEMSCDITINNTVSWFIDGYRKAKKWVIGASGG